MKITHNPQLRIPQLLFGLGILIFTFSLNGCKEEEELNEIGNTVQQELIIRNNKSDIKRLIEFGYSTDEIEILDDGYLVDNDIVFPFNHTLFQNEKQASVSSNFLVNFNKQSNIRVFLSNLEPGWAAAIQLAVSDWNTRPNSNINFNIVTNGSFDVFVAMRPQLPSNVRARAYLPVGTNPGDRIGINPIYNGNSISQKRRTMVHELGHIIGFLHTDTYVSDIAGTSYTGGYIEGTAEVDPNSFMQSSTGGTPWSGFNLYDGLLLTLNYPATPPPANSSAFYRYFGMSNGDHFYSINWNEAGGDILTTTGYRYELIEGYTPSPRQRGTIPLYRLIFTANGHHFYTTNQAEAALAVANGHQYEGIACHVFKSPQTGTVPLHRLRNISNGEHFYTTSQTEATIAVANGGYMYQGIACHIYPRPF